MTTSTLIKQQQFRRRRLNRNLGFADRQIRAVTGTLMLFIPAFTVSETLGLWSIMMLASIPVLVTAITGWDPFYAIAGKNTYEGRSEEIRQRHWTHANIGIIERAIRLGTGLAMLTALLGMPAMTGNMAFALLAIPLIVTAITAWDPFYAMMELNSFGSQIDVEAAEPGVNEKSLARYYELPETGAQSRQYANAA